MVVVEMQHARLPVGGDRFESRYGKNYRNSFDHNLLDLDMVIDCFGANRKCSNFPIGKSRLEHLLGKKTKVIGFNFFKYCFITCEWLSILCQQILFDMVAPEST